MKVKYAKHLDNVIRKRGDQPDDHQIRLHSSEKDMPIDMEQFFEFLKKNLKSQDITNYPDTDRVYSHLESTTAIHRDNLVFGHGSDSIIKNIFTGFVERGQKVVTTDPCFTMYQVYADIVNANLHGVKYKDQKCDIDGIINAIDDSTSLVIFSNPNSPIGDHIKSADIIRIIAKAKLHKCLVVIDEAYIEFSSAATYLNKSVQEDNVIVTKTYSKAMGAAGIRFGFAAGNIDVINILKKLQNMYEVTNFTMSVLEYLRGDKTFKAYVSSIRINKEILTKELLSRGYEVFTTDSNWIYTTKTEFHRSIFTKQCTLPWDDRVWTRLQVPSKISTLAALYQY